MRVILRIALALIWLVVPGAAGASSTAYEEDFAELIEIIGSSYAYLEESGVDLSALAARYREEAANAEDDGAFLRVIKEATDALRDHHVTVRPGADDDRRYVPSSADLWAEWADGEAVVTAVRAGSRAAALGFRPGHRVVSVDGVAIEEAAARELRVGDAETTAAARDWALRVRLSGRLDRPVRVEAVDAEGERIGGVFTPGAGPEEPGVIAERLSRRVGYIRFGDSLGELATIAEFDAALEAMRGAGALVIDLRNTPSGGNTTVARGILGRLTATTRPYQRHRLTAEEREFGVVREWVELVAPRGPFTHEGEVVALVGRWTGSMGEGMAIGLDAMGATVVGGPMARLRGAVYTFTLPRTGVRVNLPSERLFHVDGTPREAFEPAVRVAETGAAPLSEGDLALRAALDLIWTSRGR